jgi:hypothetical protein
MGTVSAYRAVASPRPSQGMNGLARKFAAHRHGNAPFALLQKSGGLRAQRGLDREQMMEANMLSPDRIINSMPPPQWPAPAK